MRKTYHLCLSSHDEIMFRNREDYVRGFNCFAEAVLETESRALADAEMSTHVHFGVQTDNFKGITYLARNKYSRYFNTKYYRKGRLGERVFFSTEIVGIRHMTAFLSYVNRQGLHHGLSETAFGYEHCSCNVIFQHQLGKHSTSELLPDKSRYRYLSSNSSHFTGYRMNADGLILREDIIDTGYVEEIFITPKNYLFNMRRFSDEKWLAEQMEEENGSAPVTLDLIEKGTPEYNLDRLRSNEFGRVDYSHIGDTKLCEMIDSMYLPKYFKEGETRSIYLLNERKRAEIGNRIWGSMKNEKNSFRSGCITLSQLKRCLILP